ncbi:MAG: DUF1688 family protein [Geminicoccaceae bacterium]
MSQGETHLGLGDIRDRVWSVLARIERHGSEHFEIEANALGAVATTLAERYTLDPLPSGNGWWHLGEHAPEWLDRLADRLAGADAAERSRCGFDLALIWLVERLGHTGPRDFAAGARNLLDGRYAGDGRSPQLDAAGLAAIDDEAVRPLAARLRRTLEEHPELFGTRGRFGDLFDHLPKDGDVDTLLRSLQPVGQALTASSVLLGGQPLGDVWRLEGIARDKQLPGLVPFHALLLELILDLVEPLLESSRQLPGIVDIPVPATRERCNQMLVLNIIRPKHAAVTRLTHPPGSDIVIELRCLVTALFDRLADRVRAALDVQVDRLATVRLMHAFELLAGERAGRSPSGPSISIGGAVF